MSVFVCVHVCVSECLGAALCSELQILAGSTEQMKRQESASRTVCPFSLFFTRRWVEEKRKRERQTEDGRNETKTRSESEDEGR